MLRSIRTRMGEGWLGYLQKSGSTVRILQVFGCENMKVHVHKNRATSRRSQELKFPTSRRSRMSDLQHHDVENQRRDVSKAAIFNVAMFPRVTQI